MDDIETQSLQPLIWFRYIDDVFFIWTHGEGKASIIPCRSKQLQSSLNLHLSYISTCTYYIWIKRLKMSLHLDPWLHFVVHVSLVVT